MLSKLLPVTRIIGGEEALLQNYPFMDGIVALNRAFIRSNTSHWKYDFKFSRDHLINEYVVHKKYKNEEEDYDIALLHVGEAFNGKFEKPIAYANNYYEYKEDSEVITIGWGTTEANVEPYTVPELREVSINIMQHRRCTRIYKNYNISITIRMMCAGAAGKDACVNDSGGPLIQYDGENVTLIGLFSWGIGCASNTFPGVYTKVSEFDEWITKGLHHHHRRDDVSNEYYIHSSEIDNSHEDDSYKDGSYEDDDAD